MSAMHGWRRYQVLDVCSVVCSVIAVVMLVVSFALLLLINLLQAWARRRQGGVA